MSRRAPKKPAPEIDLTERCARCGRDGRDTIKVGRDWVCIGVPADCKPKVSDGS